MADAATFMLNDSAEAPARHRARPALETRIWVSTASASIGDGLRLAALPLAVAAITNDPLQVAGLTLAQRVPPLVLALPAGVILDRVDPFRVMVACQRVRVVLVLSLAGAVAAQGVLGVGAMLAAVYALAMLLAAMEVFGDVAAQVVVQLLVADERLERTNSRVVAGQMLGEEFLGPPTGGWLFSLGRWPAFVGIGLAYAISALVLNGGLRRRSGAADARTSDPTDTSPTAALSPVRSGWREAAAAIPRETRQGLAVVVGNRDLLVQAAWTSVMNAANGAVGAVFVLFALNTLGLNGTAYGALLTAGGIGGVLGAGLAGVVARHVPRRAMMISTSLLASLCTLTLGSMDSFVAVFALQGVAALCGVMFSVVARSYRQSITPTEFAGRTTSVYRLLSLGSVPLGALAGGILATVQNPGLSIVVAGALMLAATVGAALFLRRDVPSVPRQPR
ncbi:MFS transporter [Micromonospora sp. NPDC023888]|uniref:MFS transporter n=1 Tax=Micromonospora sp. NPDC023888 TaxID=3155607 RepID=UPI0033F14E14